MPELSSAQADFLKHLKILFDSKLVCRCVEPPITDLKRIHPDRIRSTPTPVVSEFYIMEDVFDTYECIWVIWNETCEIYCWHPWSVTELEEGGFYTDIEGHCDTIGKNLPWKKAAEYLVKTLYRTESPDQEILELIRAL